MFTLGFHEARFPRKQTTKIIGVVRSEELSKQRDAAILFIRYTGVCVCP